MPETISLTVGARLRSQTSKTEVIVVRAPAIPVELACGGAPMMDVNTPTGPAPQAGGTPAGLSGETLLGKRYATADGSLELLVTKPGTGSLTVDGQVLEMKTARALPSSD
jgi:hypothetical protein